MKGFFIFIFTLILFYGCKPGIPNDVIQPTEMEKILYDIHVVDGYATTFDTATPDSLKKTFSPFYKGVYKKFGTDSAQYTRSINYYYKHPKLMAEMYEHITEKLKKARDKAAKVQDQPGPPQDNKPDTNSIRLKLKESVIPVQ